MVEQIFAEVKCVLSGTHLYIILGIALCQQLSRLGQWDLSLDAVPTHRHDLNWLSFGFTCKFKVSCVVISSALRWFELPLAHSTGPPSLAVHPLGCVITASTHIAE